MIIIYINKKNYISEKEKKKKKKKKKKKVGANRPELNPDCLDKTV
jgi:hypothetical protein